MAAPTYRTALIVGAGSGLSASLARLLSKAGLKVALDVLRQPRSAWTSEVELRPWVENF